MITVVVCIDQQIDLPAGLFFDGFDQVLCLFGKLCINNHQAFFCSIPNTSPNDASNFLN